MKLVSIINAWADTVELLPFCIENHLKFADYVIVMISAQSNRGETNSVMADFVKTYPSSQLVEFRQFEPFLKYTPKINETAKRNLGIQCALEHPAKFTHFLIADADEFYKPREMIATCIRFKDHKLNGLVHPLKVYIKDPTLCTDDHTLVPGVHKLTPTVQCGSFIKYPFAYDRQGKAHIDPTRRMSFTNGIDLSSTFMHHYSYVRKDIDLKIRNSSANLENSRQVIYDELRDAKPGYVSKLYHRPLEQVENYFDIVI